MITNSVEFFQSNNYSINDCSGDLILAAWEIKNPSNLGHIIRLGHNLGALKIYFINAEKNLKASKIRKTAGFSYQQAPWEFISEPDFFTRMDDNYKLVILETCEDSKNIFECKWPQKVILLAGNEAHGLPEKIIEKGDEKVHIPMPGGCKSMNVSHAISVAGFEWFRQIRMINV